VKLTSIVALVIAPFIAVDNADLGQNEQDDTKIEIVEPAQDNAIGENTYEVK